MKMQEEMLRNRRLVLFGEINSGIVDRLIEMINAMRLSGVTDAEIVIDSAGGSNEAALHLYDAIKGSGIRFRGLVVAKCMSSAVTVLLACNVRQALPNVRFLIHRLSRQLGYVLTAYSDIEEDIKKLREAHEKIKRAESTHKEYIRRMLKDNKMFEEFYKKDEIFCAEDALEMGLIDEIVILA